jgi:hypothetical protein
MMIVTKKKLREMIDSILSTTLGVYIHRLDERFDRLESRVVRLSKSMQPVVAQVTINTTDAFYASSLAFLVPGESRELTMSVYSDVPPGAILRLNDERLVIAGCMVSNVNQAMTDNVSASEVILKQGVRVSTIVRATVHYPLPVSVE